MAVAIALCFFVALVVFCGGRVGFRVVMALDFSVVVVAITLD